MNVKISREFDDKPLPYDLKEYADRIGYAFALAEVENFLFLNNAWYEVEIDWCHNYDPELRYVIHLWYGCDNWSMNESVEVYKEGSNYVTTIFDEDYNHEVILQGEMNNGN